VPPSAVGKAMHQDPASWQERLNAESDAFWRFDDSLQRGRLARCGQGTLGRGMLGTVQLNEDALMKPVGGKLLRTMSMPVVTGVPPCGQRVGADGEMDGLSEEPGNTMTALRRPARLTGELEDRLQLLERSLKGGSAINSRLCTPSTRSLSTGGRRTASCHGSTSASLNSLRGSTAGSQRLATQSSIGTPLHRMPTAGSLGSVGIVSSLNGGSLYQVREMTPSVR